MPAISMSVRSVSSLVLEEKIFMAQVIVTFKIMPADGDTNIDQLEKNVKEKLKPERISREPIAFGLVAVIATKLIDEVEGEMDRVENLIKSIDGVGEVEITEVNRSM